MIGLNNYVDSIAPSITINDEPFSNNVHNRTTFALHSLEPNNNNFPVIDSPAVTSVYCNHRIDDDDDDEINGNFLCLSDNTINLDDIPISALRSKSRDLLSKRLNAIKVILSENGAPRDWRGILSSIGLSDVINTVQMKSDPMKEVLDLWSNERKVNATVGNLQQILGNIDRWDVVDDTNDCFVEDSKLYMDTVSKLKERKGVNNQTKPYETNECPVIDESNILTHDDIASAKRGLPPQRYDAYLLFDNDDINFATQIQDVLESNYGLKLCLKERDLIGGTIESDAIMRMISERCNRLIVIFSKAFFESASNSFFVKFAQANSIQQRERKIIPVVFEDCKIPSNLQVYYTLRYRESSRYFDFWRLLSTSVQATVPINRISSPANMPKITITEVDSTSAMRSAVESPNQQQQPTFEFDTSNTLYKRRKERSKSPKSSSPTTPTSLKKFWTNFPKIGSQSTISTSMWTLGVTDQIFDKENERCHSSLSLNNSISSPTPTKYKKNKWFKKLLSPASAQKLSAAESDSSVGAEITTKKKKWYRKRFNSQNKTREAVADI